MSELDSSRETAAVPQPRTEPDLPAAAPAKTVVQEFVLVHDAMRHAVGLLAASAERLRPGPTPRAKELASFADFLLDFVHHHHTGEDEHWWPALEAGSAAAGAVLAPLTDDHHELDPLIAQLREHVVALRTGTHDVAAVRRDATALRDHVVEHLAAEEPVLLPLLDQHLSDADAERLSRLMGKTAPRKGMSYLLGSLDAAAPERQQVLLAKMPPPIRWLRPLMLRRYRRRVAVLVPA